MIEHDMNRIVLGFYFFYIFEMQIQFYPNVEGKLWLKGLSIEEIHCSILEMLSQEPRYQFLHQQRLTVENRCYSWKMMLLVQLKTKIEQANKSTLIRQESI